MSDVKSPARTEAVPDVQAVRAWLREPDYAESFSLNDVVDWMNRRPIAAFERLAASPASPPSQTSGAEVVCAVLPPPETYGGSPDEPWTGKPQESGAEAGGEADLIAELRDLLTDWNGADIPDSSLPRIDVLCGTLRRAVDTLDRQAKEIAGWNRAFSSDDDEFTAIADAIGTTRFMDPPDGGETPLSEQVRRMRKSLDNAEAAAALAKPASSPAGPGHTDLMVTPESLDAFLSDNSPPDMLASSGPSSPAGGDDLVAWIESLPREPTPALRAAYEAYKAAGFSSAGRVGE